MVAAKELFGGLHAASKELERWRKFAEAIPDHPIREDALHVFEHKRTHAHGAALFWAIPKVRDLNLLRLLVAYELIWDFLDNLNERAASVGTANGRQLHLAIVEAIDPSTVVSDYYLHHPWQDDGGYLCALVRTCRAICDSLPSYGLVRDLVVGEARRAQVLALNHDPDPRQRDDALRAWVASEHPTNARMQWWELSGAASAPLAIHALLALASQPRCSKAEALRVHSAYSPWICATTTMLDSYVDQIDDAASGGHSYVGHYADHDTAVARISELIVRAVGGTRGLQNGARHTVVTSAMIAMYLSKDASRSPGLRAGTRMLVRAGGSLTLLLLPALRAWRVLYAQRSA